MDASVIEHCADLFEWLEQHAPIIKNNRDLIAGARMPTIRMCNTLLRRLSKSTDVMLCARVMIFAANFYPLHERSAVNNQVKLTNHSTVYCRWQCGSVTLCLQLYRRAAHPALLL